MSRKIHCQGLEAAGVNACVQRKQSKRVDVWYLDSSLIMYSPGC